MPIFPRGCVDYYVADASVTVASQITIDFQEDPGAQMGAGSIQWIEVSPGYGFTIHLNTTCQEETDFQYSDLSKLGPGTGAYWSRASQTLFPINPGDDLSVRTSGGVETFGVDASTGNTVITGTISTGAATIVGDSSLTGNLTLTGALLSPTYIGLTPGSVPTSVSNGQFYYDSIAKEFKFREDDSWETLGSSSLWTTVAGGLAPLTLSFNLFVRDGAGNITASLFGSSGGIESDAYLQLNAAVEPSPPQDGQIYYDSASTKFKFRENGVWSELADSDLWKRSGTTIYQYNLGDTLEVRDGTDTARFIVSGSTGIASYNLHPTFTTDTEIVDKKYVDDTVGDGLSFDGTISIGDICKRSGVTTIGKVTGIPESLIVANDEISSFTNTQSGTHEVGSSVASTTFNWVMLRDGETNASQIISGTNLVGTPVTVTPGTVRTYAGTIAPALSPVSATTYTYTLNTVGDDSYADSATTTIPFRWKRYWGVWPVTGGTNLPTNAEILANFSSEFGTSRVASKAFDASIVTPDGGPPNNLFYIYPQTWGSPTQTKIGGLDFTDYTETTMSFTNASGATATYIVIYTNNATSDSAITWQIVS